jgi:N-acyl-D-amino-acid deacylase
MRPLVWILLVLCLLLPSCQPQQRYDLLILNARIIDGTGNPWFVGDVGIRGERIAAIGHLVGSPAVRTLDAAGRYVSPGFIDMMGQSEYALLADNRALSKISQGITTEITGEGESVAPQSERTRAELNAGLARYGIAVDWTDLDGYFHRLEKTRHAVNLGTFVGATQVREAVIGFENRPPTPAELEQMKREVGHAMDRGALGLSSALVYAPAVYATTPELIELATVAAERGGIYATHIRNEGDHCLEALYEASDIARAAKIPVEVWHLKSAGRQNWGKMSEITRLISRFRAEGLDLTADIYPYTASATSLAAALPVWVLDGGREAMLKRLGDPAVRQKIKAELEGRATAYENMYRGAGPEGILLNVLAAPALKMYEGSMLSTVATAMKKHPVDALMDVVIADSGRTGAIYFSMNEADVRMAMSQPWVSFNTDYEAAAVDGPLHVGKPHPRAYGSFARVLAKYVRDDRVLGLEEAIRKMTSLPAQRVGIGDRGILRVGMCADLVLFDLANVKDRATFEQPHQYSEGMDLVIVNGQPVWENGGFTGNLPGKIVRGPGYRQE